MIITEETYDELRRQVDELRAELDRISGGWEARVENRRKLDRELENVRGELGLIRGELGIVREQRNTLREELRLAQDRRQQVVQLLDESRAQLTKAQESARSELATVRAHRMQLRQQLTEARNEQRIDGLRLFELICDACPTVLNEDFIVKIGLDTVDELDRALGVTVYRGHPDHAWKLPCPAPWPRDTPNATAKPVTEVTEMCFADAGLPRPDPNVDRQVQYAVLTGSRGPGDEPFCVTKPGSYAEAQFTAAHLPGAWVGQRSVTTEKWTPVDEPTPNR